MSEEQPGQADAEALSEVEHPDGGPTTDDLGRSRQDARVIRGQIGFTGQPTLFSESVGADFLAALTSGVAEVERYARVWRLGRIAQRNTSLGPVVFSRLGYQARDRETSVWDDATKDWTQELVPRGETVAFAVRLSDLRLAFQIRPPAVTVAGFRGALEALLNREAPERPWIVELGTTRPEYRVWREGITRVLKARGHLETPNPHWIGREKIEAFFEDFHVDEATLNLTFDDDAPADEVDVVVSQMVDHAERGYGSAVVVGERGQNGERVEYRTEVEQTPATVPTDEHGEATWVGLAELLGDEGEGEVTLDDAESPPAG